MNFMRQFEGHRCIGKILITEEDKHRGQQYFHDRKRREFKETMGTIEDFYRSLDQRLTVHVNNVKHRARIAQLSQRTNQFNMTTVRLTESDVAELMDDPNYWLLTADLADRFGDNGTVAYVQVKKSGRFWTIENFLMSCRVLGRTVEESVLNYIGECARREGAGEVRASFVPTKKNQPFAEFYPKNGFVECEPGPAGEMRYVISLEKPHSPAAYVDIVENQNFSVV
jgi:FkbH-like protein